MNFRHLKKTKEELLNLTASILNKCVLVDSEGIKNGIEIVSEYLEHNEYGLALDHLAYIISETSYRINKGELSTLWDIANKLKVTLPEF